MRPPSRAASLLVALAHGAAEALPVSSSGHLAAAEALLGVAEDEDPVGLHAGSLAAIVLSHAGEALEVLRRPSRQRVALHLAAGGIPAVAGLTLERRGADLPAAPGMLAGALLLALAGRRRGGRSRWDAGPADGA